MKKVFIVVLLMLLVISGCGKNDTSSKGESGTTGLFKKDIAVDGERLGNTSSNTTNGGFIDEEDGWLYYSLDDGIYKCKEDGSKREKIVEFINGTQASYINVIEDWIYYSSSGIWKVKTNGDEEQQIVRLDGKGGIHYFENWIYYGREYKVDYDGENAIEIYDPNEFCGFTFNVVDGWMYFYDEDEEGNNGIYKVKSDASEIVKLYDARADYMVVDGEWIYFENQERTPSRMYRIRTDGTDAQELCGKGVGSLNVLDGWLYYEGVCDDISGLYKQRLDGTENQLLFEDFVTHVHVIGEWVYFDTNSERGKVIYRIKTDGTDYQVFAHLEESN